MHLYSTRSLITFLVFMGAKHLLLILILALSTSAFAQSLDLSPSPSSTDSTVFVWQAWNKVADESTSFFAPQIRWSRKNQRIGYIRVGSSITRTFSFTNVGNGPLQISRISTNCICTNGQCVPTRVRSGSSGRIIVTVSPDKPGYFKQYIRVTSNARGFVQILSVEGVAYQR